MACITSTRKTENNENKYDANTYINIIQLGIHVWCSVAHIITHLLKHLYSIDVGLREVFLKGDNAGCYHSTCLVAYLSHLYTLSPNEVIELYCLHRRNETSRIAEHREKRQSDGTGTKNPTTEVSIETDGKFYNRS